MLTIDKPIITEKSMDQAKKGVYTFAVNSAATKPEIAKAVAKMYGVTVKVVRVMTIIGKEVRRKGGIGRARDWKKAIVTLNADQKIKEFELPEESKDKTVNPK